MQLVHCIVVCSLLWVHPLTASDVMVSNDHIQALAKVEPLFNYSGIRKWHTYAVGLGVCIVGGHI
eukprot:1492233-Ditylum_brightwellii.AAC.1